MLRILLQGLLLVFVIFGSQISPLGAGEVSIQDARRGFKTTLVREVRNSEPHEQLPEELFALVHYESPVGKLAAYVSKPPSPGTRYPAIVWITGGFPPGGIGDAAWKQVSNRNDQSAKAFRLAGMVILYPTVRGSFGNPGNQESFLGEVDDVVAAADYLAKLEYVDPKRIYLGGHSTGGTLALLVAATTDRFRAVITFGPAGDPVGYGEKALTYDPADEREANVRAPIRYLSGIRTPTYVIEGMCKGNHEALLAMKQATENPKLTFCSIRGGNHFDILAPLTKVFAEAAARAAPDAPLAVKEAQLQDAYDQLQVVNREAADLQTLADVRARGVDLGKPQAVRHYLYATDGESLERALPDVRARGFEAAGVQEQKDSDGEVYYEICAIKRMTLEELKAVFLSSSELAEIRVKHSVDYGGWTVD